MKQGTFMFFNVMIIIALCTFPRLNGSAAQEQFKNELTKYTRPITLLEINPPSSWYFSVSPIFRGTWVLMEWPWRKITHQAFVTEHPDNVIVLQRPYYYLENLHQLSEQEHFDIIIAHNPHNWFDIPYHQIIEAICMLGDMIFIVTDEIVPLFKLDSDTVRIENPIEQLLLLQHSKNHIGKQKNEYVLHSTYDEKKLYSSRKAKTTDWIHGITLKSFKAFNGTYPAYKNIVQNLKACSNKQHNDMNSSNFILQGAVLELIDFNDPQATWALDNKEALTLTLWEFDRYKQRTP